MGQYLNSKEPYDQYKTVMNVDYAHNAVSMESLLATLREYHPKRLVVVFGCGRTDSGVGTGAAFLLHYTSETFWKNSYGQYDCGIFFEYKGAVII